MVGVRPVLEQQQKRASRIESLALSFCYFRFEIVAVTAEVGDVRPVTCDLRGALCRHNHFAWPFLLLEETTI